MSSTRLSALLDGILEAGWLAAIIVTPLFFNIYSSRVFEPDKLTTLRSIALVMSAIWLIRWVEERAARRQGDRPPAPITWRTPLILPTLLTIAAYIISTALSVTPYTSFFGSYQRLQGTFTTFSYIVIFFIILERMRTRAQVDRFITTLILNSLPIALYGFVQHARRDPLPWGGDVVERVASNMGNAIFVAAYLIMVVPATLARIVDSFRAILSNEGKGWVMDVLRAAGYIFILLVQVIAIYYARSRGPTMGLIFGMGMWTFLGLILLQQRTQRQQEGRRVKWRLLWVGALAVAVILAIFFFAINPGGPLHDWALHQPSIGRFSQVLETESGGGKVRALIWEGGVKLILPHEPLEYPQTATGPARADPFNAIRLLVGYGPESMYVAYNHFYPPLLGHFESRTASPDRSHNETLDSLIITGVVGFVAYLWLFGSVFYFGLRWLGLLPGDWRRVALFTLMAAGVVVMLAWTGLTVGWHFFCLAIPIGMALGMLVYLLVYGFTLSQETGAAQESHPHAVLLISILAAVMAHFVEINFGIAIASTRTTFWALAGLFVLLGLQRIGERESPPVEARVTGGGRKRRPVAPPTSRLPAWLWPALGASLIGALIIGTLAYDFTNNVERLTNPLTILWHSLSIIAVGGPARTSLGILMVFVLTWLAIALLTVTQIAQSGVFQKRRGEEWIVALIVLTISLTVGLIFGLILAGRHAHVLTTQVHTIPEAVRLAEYVSGQVSAYYIFLAIVILLGGLALAGERVLSRRWATPAGALALLGAVVAWLSVLLISAGSAAGATLSLSRLGLAVGIGVGVSVIVGALAHALSPTLQPQFAAVRWMWIPALLATVLLSLAPVAAVQLNLNPIRADIVFKQADQWEQSGQYIVAVSHYQRAIQITPWQNEDFYYLYMGRAYLEYAAGLTDTTQQDLAIRETERVLLQAQAINPLNTDHSANLARMYRRWAGLPAGQPVRDSLLDLASHYYDVATSLSPQNCILWNEWATLYYYDLQDPLGYQRTISHSLELDAGFSQTWMIIGDTRTEQGDLAGAAEAYREAVRLQPSLRAVWIQLGRIYLQSNQNISATEVLSQANSLSPTASDAWDVHRLLAIAYYQEGLTEAALGEAQWALLTAPADQQQAMQELVDQLQSIITGTESTP